MITEFLRENPKISSVLLIAGIGFISFTFSGLTTSEEITFMTDSDSGSSPYYSNQISNGLTLYGQEIYLENLEASTVSEGSTTLEDSESPVAIAHWGDQQKNVFSDNEEIVFENGVIEIRELEASYCWEAVGTHCQQKDYINNILWNWRLDLNESSIQASMENGEVELENQWNPVKVGSLTVNGEEKSVDTLDEGFTSFEVGESVDSVEISISNPSVPQGSVSGKPNIDSDFRTVESFEAGGVQPSSYELEDNMVDGACDIQYLESKGFGEADCQYTRGGEPVKEDTLNHRVELEDLTVTASLDQDSSEEKDPEDLDENREETGDNSESVNIFEALIDFLVFWR